MNQKNTGYVAIKFKEKSIIKLNIFASQIGSDNFFYKKLEGEIEGGNVANKAHLTLFYGLNDLTVDKNEIKKILSQISIDKVYVEKLSLFEIKKFGCKALILKVIDEEGKMKKTNDSLGMFETVTDLQKFNFIPHITIAYVKKEYEPTPDILESFPRELEVESIEYLVKK